MSSSSSRLLFFQGGPPESCRLSFLFPSPWMPLFPLYVLSGSLSLSPTVPPFLTTCSVIRSARSQIRFAPFLPDIFPKPAVGSVGRDLKCPFLDVSLVSGRPSLPAFPHFSGTLRKTFADVRASVVLLHAQHRPLTTLHTLASAPPRDQQLTRRTYLSYRVFPANLPLTNQMFGTAEFFLCLNDSRPAQYPRLLRQKQ